MRFCTTLILVSLLAFAAPPRDADAVSPVDLGAAPSLGGIRFAADASANPVVSGEATVVISYAVAYDELFFLRHEDGYRARFEVTAILYDGDGDQATGDSWRREVRVDRYDQTNSRRLTVREELELRVESGEYRLKVELRSLDTRSTGVVEAMVDVPEISSDGLTLGTIVFERENGEGPADTSVVLNPAREYGEDNPVARIRVPVYAAPGMDYELDVTVETSDGRVQKSLADTVSQTEFRTEHVRSFTVLDLEVGNYFARVSVRPVPDGDRVVRRARFRIVTSPKSWGEDFDKMIAQIGYVASRDDVDRLLESPPELRDEAWEDFWSRNDPDPATEWNEFKDEFLRRLGEANLRFGSILEGWQTDMGRVYIQHGEPDDIDSQPVGKMLNAWETWFYYGEHTKFIFVDREGFGEYRLVEVSRI